MSEQPKRKRNHPLLGCWRLNEGSPFGTIYSAAPIISKHASGIPQTNLIGKSDAYSASMDLKLSSVSCLKLSLGECYLSALIARMLPDYRAR